MIYEAIGKFVVYSLATVAMVATVCVVLFLALYTWVRAWQKVANWAWKGYEVHGDEFPPMWKRQVSIFAICMYKFNPRKFPEAIRQIESDDERADDETLVEWMKRVFKL